VFVCFFDSEINYLWPDTAIWSVYVVCISIHILILSLFFSFSQGQEEPQRILFRKAKFLGFLVDNFLPFSITFNDYLERSASSKASDGGDANSDNYSIARFPVFPLILLLLAWCMYCYGNNYAVNSSKNSSMKSFKGTPVYDQFVNRLAARGLVMNCANAIRLQVRS